MRTILFFVCLTGLLFACYDDKGNYDYHDINQITISGVDSLICYIFRSLWKGRSMPIRIDSRIFGKLIVK